jgi:hypothetical protein
MDETFTIHEAGTVRTQVWHYPSRSECLTCHTPIAGLALGFNTAQLNRESDYNGAPQNQIRALSDAGYFSSKVGEFYTLPALAHPTNAAVSLDFRVHSYLAANCVQCHQPGGAVRHLIRLSTPLSTAGLINGSPLTRSGIPKTSSSRSIDRSGLLTRPPTWDMTMPPLATAVLNSWHRTVKRLITKRLAQQQSYRDWQLANFGSTNAPNAAPGSDADDDSAINQLEYLTGTNPMLAGDGWGIGFAIAETQAEIQFPRIANLAFEVQWTTDLDDPNSWQPLNVPDNEPLFSASSSSLTVQDQVTSAPRKFYRVRILEP